MPVSKWPKKGVRPLLVGSAWRRLLARGLLGERKREVLDFFQANSRVQQFVSAEDGAANCFYMFSALERQVREEGACPDVDVDAPRAACACFLALDVRNAFNALSRRAIWKVCEKHYLRVDRPK